MSEQLDRRRFLKSAAGGTVVLAAMPVLGLAPGDSLAPGCKVLTISQGVLVGAIAEQFVPADEHSGGREAGVVFYIDGILAGRLARSYKDRYERGLKLVDEVSHKQFNRNFVSLDAEQQVSVLKAMESGDAVGSEAHEFFTLILQHTMEGYYGDPEHGGNRNGASWKMLGFEG